MIRVRLLHQADIMRCPFRIVLPTHYREDGTCKCDCKVERQRMIDEWDYTDEHFKSPEFLKRLGT